MVPNRTDGGELLELESLELLELQLADLLMLQPAPMSASTKPTTTARTRTCTHLLVWVNPSGVDVRCLLSLAGGGCS